MKVEALIELQGTVVPPDPWDESWGPTLKLDHIICRDVSGTPHTVGDFIWPWTAYAPGKRKNILHFFYWKQTTEKLTFSNVLNEVTPERLGRVRELQFLMTRQIYFGRGNSFKSLNQKLRAFFLLARFAEARSCTVRDVLTDPELLVLFGDELPGGMLGIVNSLITFLRQLDTEKQLGFSIPKTSLQKNLTRRGKEYRESGNQFSPLPTRIYAAVINSLSLELDDIERHEKDLIAAIRASIKLHKVEKGRTKNGLKLGRKQIEAFGLTAYLERRGFAVNRIRSLGAAVADIFRVCKLQIHIFSGMRDEEANLLPFHCMRVETGQHGRTHCLIAGSTTKLNNGRRLRTNWVTTEQDGFRAIRIAQRFAALMYEVHGVTPSRADALKDNYPLFPSTNYFPWTPQSFQPHKRFFAQELKISHRNDLRNFFFRICPIIEDDDIAELEEIDPFRDWHSEAGFAAGALWPLTTHQFRRSLAIYANASGLVRLSSLRRQLQHISREMSMYYGRGSIFCKNFVLTDPVEYRKHIAVEWQDGSEEAQALAFVRDVLGSPEPMFGGAGIYYEVQRSRGDVMTLDQALKQIKAGVLAYRESPLGGCTRAGFCGAPKGLKLVNTACITKGCKDLVGKHSKIVRTIGLKRASMIHLTAGSITEAMEQEELEELERLEVEWRTPFVPASSTAAEHD